jgi:hypothetical protein
LPAETFDDEAASRTNTAAAATAIQMNAPGDLGQRRHLPA